MEKSELRKLMKEEKARYDMASREALSKQVLEKLETQPVFKQAHTILLYYSLKDEVQTHDFVEKWSSKKKIILPVVVGDDLELRIYTGKQDLSIGAFNIEEPTGALFTDYSSIDLAVIPGVAFDTAGHRLGRGKGYYDRLLPRIKATKIGICFPFQLLAEVPTQPFDIAMNTVITL